MLNSREVAYGALNAHDETTLRRVLAPVDASAATRLLQSGTPCLWRRDNPYLFSVNEMDQVLSTARFRPDEVRVMMKGQPQRVRVIAQGGGRGPSGVDSQDLLDRFFSGATIIFEDFQTRHAFLSQLTFALSAWLHAWVNANVYVTPPGTQGLAPHVDSHDVLVLQVAGEKTWSFGTAVEDRRSPDVVRIPLEEPVTLTTGDALLMPAGVRHVAHTGTRASIHVTFGMIPVMARDVVTSILASNGGAMAPLRGDDIDRRVERTLRGLLEVVGQRELVDAVEREISAPAMFHPSLQRGRFEHAFAPGLHPSTLVEMRHYPRPTLTRTDSDVVIRYNGKDLHFENACYVALTMLLDADSPVPLELLPLDHEKRLSLGRDLVECGLARIVDQGT
jgi:hypothetical protein